MKSFKWVIAFVFLSGSHVFAKTNAHPEIFWQPFAGRVATSLSFLYQSTDITDNVSSVVHTEKGTGQGFELGLEYGLTHWLSFGVGYDWNKIESDVTVNNVLTPQVAEGPGDWNFNMKLMIPSAKTRLYLGAEYNLSTANSTQRNHNTTRLNRMTGGNSVTGIAGVQMPMGPLWIGLRGEYTVFDERTVEIDGVETSKLTDGGVLDVLANFEAHSDGSVFGIGAGIFQKQKEVSTNVSTQVATTTQAIDKIHFKVYYSSMWAKWFTILLEANYFAAEDIELNTTDTRVESTELDGKVTLRFIF